VIAAIFAGILSFVGQMTVRVLLNSGGGRSDDRKGGGAGLAIIIAIALAALSWFLAILLKLALSRRREFLADAGSVELTKDPDAMISALKRIEHHARIEHVPSLVQEAFIENPGHGFSSLFDTHPSIEARIAALVKFGGGNADAVIDDPRLAHGQGPAQIEATDPAAAGPAPEMTGPWNTPAADQVPPSAAQGSFIPTPGQPLPWGPKEKG